MLWILIVCLFFLLILTLICYYITFYSPHPRQNDPFHIPTSDQYNVYAAETIDMIQKTLALPYEWVSIISRDGTKLSARYCHHADGAPVDICVHGYRGTAIRDFCGGARALLSHGHNVLIIDQRGQGKSSGHTITFGIRERYDCLDWIAYVQKRFGSDTRIGLYGVSMGATTVLMASGLDLPNTVYGILADSPFSSPRDIICSVCESMGYPSRILYPFIRFSARVWGGFDLEEITAEEAVRKSNTPIAIVHGEDDRYVPCQMSAAIGADSSYVERHVFPSAGHVLSYMVDAERYAKIMNEFVSRAV